MPASTESNQKDLLPISIVQWIEEDLGARILSVAPRAGGGASREGAMLRVSFAQTGETDCYLTYDLRDPENAARLAGFEAEASAISAMQGTAVTVPQLLAYDVGRRAMLTARVPGEARFDVLIDEASRRQVAFDFMRQLAALHAMDVTQLPLRGFVEPASVSIQIRERLKALAAKHAEGAEDPLLVFGLRWLEDNVPQEPTRTVLVHGDAGPANFLHHEGEVTAILDWEMTHLGDPMEDLAWIAVRDLFQPFVALPECFAEYVRASDAAMDIPRVRYHRAYALINLVIDTHADLVQNQGAFTGIYGNYLMYYTLHCRVLVEGIAEALGLDLPALVLPDCPPGQHDRSYAVALLELREQVVPRVTDEVAAHRIKSMARLVKFWQACDRFGAQFERAEMNELAEALDTPFSDLREARQAFVEAIRARTIDEARIVRLLALRVQRDTALMAPAMGALSTRQFATLT
ncbi:phosphotransferase family protein [Pseudomonas sp. NFX15]|uniref:phosphotransferase family protein n=1 Tax=Pseudomonas sp. NFX15 TaxID=2816958 RepID=UPI003B8D2933